jgi:hypothetical protein
VALTLALAGSASAQQFTSSAQTSSGFAALMPSNFSGFLNSTMSRPDLSAMSQKPQVPMPVNQSSFFPTFSLQNTMLLRNMFGGPQTAIQMPTRQVPPPPMTPTTKKKSILGF